MGRFKKILVLGGVLVQPRKIIVVRHLGQLFHKSKKPVPCRFRVRLVVQRIDKYRQFDAIFLAQLLELAVFIETRRIQRHIAHLHLLQPRQQPEGLACHLPVAHIFRIEGKQIAIRRVRHPDEQILVERRIHQIGNVIHAQENVLRLHPCCQQYLQVVQVLLGQSLRVGHIIIMFIGRGVKIEKTHPGRAENKRIVFIFIFQHIFHFDKILVGLHAHVPDMVHMKHIVRVAQHIDAHKNT